MIEDITNLIERLEVFEERLGVTIDGLFAGIRDSNFPIVIQGELHPREGVHIAQDLLVIASLHDSEGRVLDIDHSRIFADSFYGFETFQIIFTPTTSPIARIRVYPKPD